MISIAFPCPSQCDQPFSVEVKANRLPHIEIVSARCGCGDWEFSISSTLTFGDAVAGYRVVWNWLVPEKKRMEMERTP